MATITDTTGYQLRIMEICPMCEGRKDKGLLMCWACWNRYYNPRRYGMTPRTVARMEKFAGQFVGKEKMS